MIDEVGSVEVEPAQVGQFFTLMHNRHRNKTTIITSNLGFGEWGSFLENPQLTAALAGRLTSNSHVINMQDHESLRGRIDDQLDQGSQPCPETTSAGIRSDARL